MLDQKGMEEVRRPYEDGMWIDIGRFVNIRRENMTISSASLEKGQRKGTRAFDGTPLGALNTWADGMQGFLFSRNWFKSQMSNPTLNHIDAVREWLQVYDLKMYSAFERGNFYAILGQWFRDAGSIGTATLFSEEEVGQGTTVHTVIHPREIFIREDQYGMVDTVHRKFNMTAHAAFDKFGEKVSEAIKKNAKDKPDADHQFLHAVFPNKDRIFGKRTSGNKAFRSIYIETKAAKGNISVGQSNAEIVRDSGFDINPYAVWRFRKSSDEPYGYSPAADALVEVFQLNQYSKTLQQAAQMSVDPPLNVPVEMRNRVRNRPHGNNYYEDPKRVIQPVFTQINYPVGDAERLRVERSMQDKFRVEFFRAFIGRQGEATATEIMAIKGEQATLMIPQVDSVYVEGIRPAFAIVSDIEDKNGAFSEDEGMPPMPPEIEDEIGRGGFINFILTGPLAQAQRRATEVEPAIQTLELAARTAEVLGPEVLDVYKKVEIGEFIAESGNMNQSLLNSRDEIIQIQEDRAAAIEQERQALLAIEAAKVAPGLGKSVEENSPLEAIGAAVG